MYILEDRSSKIRFSTGDVLFWLKNTHIVLDYDIVGMWYLGAVHGGYFAGDAVGPLFITVTKIFVFLKKTQNKKVLLNLSYGSPFMKH